jgi:hypothetical protein
MDQDIVIGLLICYGLSGKGLNLWWGKGIFFPSQNPPRQALESTQLRAVGSACYWGMALTMHLHLMPRLGQQSDTVTLCLCLWDVTGRTIPLYWWWVLVEQLFWYVCWDSLTWLQGEAELTLRASIFWVRLVQVHVCYLPYRTTYVVHLSIYTNTKL